MNTEIMVSVICCAYNQEKYIEDALKGFVMQKTNFAYEVLISDDASTDSTAEIIRRYEREYPEIIKPLYLTENQYSKGIYPAVLLRPNIKGKYVAICEGDDYWISDQKLQKQFDVLEAHPEIDMCAHKALLVRANDKKTMGTVAPIQEEGILSMEQVIDGGGNYIATNSLFYRTDLLLNPPQFVTKYFVDYAIQMQGAMRGGIYYLDETMSAYRRGAEQSWTLYMEKNQEVMIRHIHMMMDMLKLVNEETHYKFSESISQANRKYAFQLAGIKQDIKSIYSREYADFRRQMPPKKRLILFLKCFAPWSLKLWQKARGH